MNKYLKQFLHRGLIFGGFGPIIAAIIYAIINISLEEELIISSKEVLILIFSTYLLAFVQAGASVFNQIDNWSLLKSLVCHSLSIYFVYVLCYIVNSWIPFELIALILFTILFFVTYMIIWFTVYLILKATSKKLNKMIK